MTQRSQVQILPPLPTSVQARALINDQALTVINIIPHTFPKSVRLSVTRGRLTGTGRHRRGPESRREGRKPRGRIGGRAPNHDHDEAPAETSGTRGGAVQPSAPSSSRSSPTTTSRALTTALALPPDVELVARAVYDAVAGLGPLQRHLDDRPHRGGRLGQRTTNRSTGRSSRVAR